MGKKLDKQLDKKLGKKLKLKAKFKKSAHTSKRWTISATKSIEQSIQKDFHSSARNIFVFTRWLFLSIIIGMLVGSLSTLFVKSLKWVTEFREMNPNIIFGMPLAGVAIILLYRVLNYKHDKGTNLVISTIHAESEIPFKMAPLIFISTTITHLFGGSAGREGAALQLGGSIGNQLGRWLKLDEKDTRVVVMCGMSAAFAAMFGTPMAAAIFSIEVVSVGIMYYAALVPCVFSALVASMFATTMEINPETFDIGGVPVFEVETFAKITLLGVLCAVLSIVFIRLLHGTGLIYKKLLLNHYVRIIVASLILILMIKLLNTTDYSGAGINLIESAVNGQARPEDFLLKMLFTAITLKAGFKGGEIVPSFAIGATFGCLFGTLIGLSPSTCAAVAMVSVFCGVTNCPITSMIIGFELFGFDAVKYMLVGVSISYMLSGYYSLYGEQRIVYSKLKTRYINRKATK